MALGRFLNSALVGGLFLAVQLGAQAPTGGVSGRIVDNTTQQPLAGVNVVIEGTQLGTLTRNDGSFQLSSVPVGTQRVRTSRIGYAPQQQEVTVTSGATATVQFALQPQAALLSEMVVTGYGTQRREAITGSIATVDAEAANVGVVSNANDMIQGRVAGVQVTSNHGEPGAGAQIRIRGGTSISASNEPLYVIDGVPIQNADTEASGIGIGGSPALPRSPLNLINPNDIESITILKDASSTAIYGARAANGVILIQTKQGAPGTASLEYDTYAAVATRASSLDLLNGDEYRQFIQQQVTAGNLPATRLAELGAANTDWERALTRTAVTHNHNLSFAGGSQATRYRASLNYMNQQGVVLANGFERYQGRLNGTHHALDSRLRLGLNLTASHIENDYLPFENTGGFEGGVFTNMVNFNPTRPVTVIDGSTNTEEFYEAGTGRQSVRNPVALAHQVLDFGNTTRTLGNVTGDLDLLSNLTAGFNLGIDRSEGTRRSYFPRASPVGAEWDGRARQVNRDLTSITLQMLGTYRQELMAQSDIEIVGGYEYNDFTIGEFGAEGRGFLTDATGYNNLGGGSELIRPFSWREESRLVSFFSRANYSFRDRYFLTGAFRYDGSSRFGAGNKWAMFPALSASWRISEEPFMPQGAVSDLRLRVGWGRQGNPGVPPYASLILLETSGGARYVFGETPVTGVAPVRNPNPNLKWEETEQINFAVDYGLLNNLVSGSFEYYIKNTTDLLLTVAVPQPAVVSSRLENIGRIRNQGFEAAIDALAMSRPNLTWNTGLVLAVERNKVVDLGGRSFITTGGVSGQGQSGQVSQRIMPGHALGTFYGAEFTRVASDLRVVGTDTIWMPGQQLFRCARTDVLCLDGETRQPTSDDYTVIGNANPDFTLGLRNQILWGRVDLSFLIRSSVGGDVFNNTALVYATKGNALQDKNFLRSALDDPTGINEPSIYSSRWIEDATFVRLQNVTVAYTFDLPRFTGQARNARVYVSGDNLLLLTGYSGYDPEVHTEAGLASRGIDYLSYPRPRTVTAGLRLLF